jgi:hypothetical protein
MLEAAATSPLPWVLSDQGGRQIARGHSGELKRPPANDQQPSGLKISDEICPAPGAKNLIGWIPVEPAGAF